MKKGFWKHGLGFIFLSTLIFANLASATEHFVIIDDDDKFTPSTLQIQFGDTVTWINQDYTFFPHSTTSDQGYWNGILFEPDDEYSVIFNLLGTFPYHDQGSSATGSITVVGGNSAPLITITNPVSDAIFTAAATFSIQADASDSDGSVTNVEFFVGGTSIGNDATPNPYSATASNLFAGDYIISAVATDNAGAMTTNSISISVTNPPIILGSPTTIIIQGQFQFQISGLVVGKTNIVQASINLTNWTSLRTNVATTNKSSFTDLQTVPEGRRFYRVIQLP